MDNEEDVMVLDNVTKFHKILIKTIRQRCDILMYEKTDVTM